MTLWTEIRELLKDIQFAWRLARLRRQQAERRAIAKEQREVARDQQRVARDLAKLNQITGVQFPVVASCPECGHDFRVNDTVETKVHSSYDWVDNMGRHVNAASGPPLVNRRADEEPGS